MSGPNGFHTTAILNEYIFARMIEEYNRISAQNNRSAITSSTGRWLHHYFLKKLMSTVDLSGHSHLDMSSLNAQAFVRIFLHAFAAIFHQRFLPDSPVLLLEQYEHYRKEFCTSLRWELSDSSLPSECAPSSVTLDGYLPISPYDLRFQNRDVIARNGTEILYARASDILKLSEHQNFSQSVCAPAFSHCPKAETTFLLYHRTETPEGDFYHPAGLAWDSSDCFGFAKLRPYLSTEDYDLALRWTSLPMKMNARQTSPSHALAPDQCPAPSDIEHALLILRTLQAEGLRYRLLCGRSRGHLLLFIEDLSTTITLLCPEEGEDFPGKILYQESSASSPQKAAYALLLAGKEPAHVPNTEQLLSLIHYALGKNFSSRAIHLKDFSFCIRHHAEDSLPAPRQLFSSASLPPFDMDSAQPLAKFPSPDIPCILSSIYHTACDVCCEIDPESILIDKNGVLSYHAVQYLDDSFSSRTIFGILGQVFLPDVEGIVQTSCFGEADQIFTPGYDAYFHPSFLGNDLPKTLRLSGLLQKLLRRISLTLHYDLLSPGLPVREPSGRKVGVSVGTSTSLNPVYSQILRTCYPIHLRQHKKESLKDTYQRQCRNQGISSASCLWEFHHHRSLVHIGRDVLEQLSGQIGYHQKHLESFFENLFTPPPATVPWIYKSPLLPCSEEQSGLIRCLIPEITIRPDGTISTEKSPSFSM